MKSLDKLFELADKFEKKAQISTGGIIKNILRAANLWDIPSSVAPLLGRAGAPDRTAADISIVVNPGLTVSFETALTPNYPSSATTFNNLLTQKFGHLMTAALRKHKINVDSPVRLSWLRVTELKQ